MNKGYGLIEILAVILIIALGLYFTLPKILGTNTIKEANETISESMGNPTTDVTTENTISPIKEFGIKDSAIMIARTAEINYQTQLLLDNTDNVSCSDIVKLNNEYEYCTIKYDNNGTATVSLKGSDTGKFKNIICSGTKDNMVCSK